jgi:hypothetical protein
MSTHTLPHSCVPSACPGGPPSGVTPGPYITTRVRQELCDVMCMISPAAFQSLRQHRIPWHLNKCTPQQKRKATSFSTSPAVAFSTLKQGAPPVPHFHYRSCLDTIQKRVVVPSPADTKRSVMYIGDPRANSHVPAYDPCPMILVKETRIICQRSAHLKRAKTRRFVTSKSAKIIQ